MRHVQLPPPHRTTQISRIDFENNIVIYDLGHFDLSSPTSPPHRIYSYEYTFRIRTHMVKVVFAGRVLNFFHIHTHTWPIILYKLNVSLVRRGYYRAGYSRHTLVVWLLANFFFSPIRFRNGQHKNVALPIL